MSILIAKIKIETIPGRGYYLPTMKDSNIHKEFAIGESTSIQLMVPMLSTCSPRVYRILTFIIIKCISLNTTLTWVGMDHV